MNKINMFCISLNPKHLNLIKNLNYFPVGLGEEHFSNEWLSDKFIEDISNKNKYYGEYTFHYYLWKYNKISYEGWLGFCQYRKFWLNNKNKNEIINFNDLKQNILSKIPANLSGYESIIGEDFYVNQLKLSKFIKHNFKTVLSNPNLLFDKNKRTIKFHFDMMHGKGNLDKAISVLNKSDRDDFKEYVNTEVSFSPHNMFVCKSFKILFTYYESLFPWLFNCEKIFGFNSEAKYGLKRIYGFLAERYLSYWFKKYTNFIKLPIQFKDLSDFL